MFLLGLLWCCDCEVTLGSLRGGVHKIVNQITPASQSDPSIHENICILTKETHQVAEKHGWTHRRYWLHKAAVTEYCLCQGHTGHTQEYLGIDHPTSSHFKSYAATLGPSNRSTEPDKDPSQHRLLDSAYCFKPTPSAHIALTE